MSADIASRAARRRPLPEDWRRLAKVYGEANLATSLQSTQRSQFTACRHCARPSASRGDLNLERVRKIIRARVHRAILLIADHHPQLAEHLRDSIETGNGCTYRPAETLEWTVVT
jgi:hypothetical protein